MANLAARCTGCGTVFRVVPDQLRVASGLVRCGRCAQVFNATESLMDLDAMSATPAQRVPTHTPAPERPADPVPEPVSAQVPKPVRAFLPDPIAPAEPAPPPASASALNPGSIDLSAAADAAEVGRFVEAPAAPAAEPGTHFELVLPASAQAARASPPSSRQTGLPEPQSADVAALQPWSGGELRLDAPSPPKAEPDLTDIPSGAGWSAGEHDARLEPFLDHAPTKYDAVAGQAAASPEFELDPLRAEPAAGVAGALNDAAIDAAADARSAAAEFADSAEPAPDDRFAPVPSFVLKAESAQRWRSPRVRAWMGAGVVAGLLLLAGQYTFTFRDTLVAKHPVLRPLLEPTCVALGCRIEAPRLIEQLAVESSGLVRVEKSAVYKLQLALRNRDSIDVAMPALDLTLSDAQGKPLARRVLRMSELGVTDTTLAAGRELAVQATLQAAFQPPTAVVAGYTIELFYP